MGVDTDDDDDPSSVIGVTDVDPVSAVAYGTDGTDGTGCDSQTHVCVSRPPQVSFSPSLDYERAYESFVLGVHIIK